MYRAPQRPFLPCSRGLRSANSSGEAQVLLEGPLLPAGVCGAGCRGSVKLAQKLSADPAVLQACGAGGAGEGTLQVLIACATGANGAATAPVAAAESKHFT
jgi:hypothetical protein